MLLWLTFKLPYTGIEPDSKLYRVIVEKALGRNEYKMLYDEHMNYEVMERLLENVVLSGDARTEITKLIEDGEIFDIKKLMNRLENNTDRIKLIQSIMNVDMDINHLTYWNFLQKSSEDGLVEENRELLRMLKDCLSETERQILNEKFWNHLGKFGGKGKFFIQRSKDAASIYNKALQSNNQYSFYYLLGKSIGIESN